VPTVPLAGESGENVRKVSAAERRWSLQKRLALEQTALNFKRRQNVRMTFRKLLIFVQISYQLNEKQAPYRVLVVAEPNDVCRRTIPIPQRFPLVETSVYLLQDNRTVSQLKT